MGDDFLQPPPRALTYGDVTDLSNFGGAVVDARSFTRTRGPSRRAKSAPGVTVAVGW